MLLQPAMAEASRIIRIQRIDPQLRIAPMAMEAAASAAAASAAAATASLELMILVDIPWKLIIIIIIVHGSSAPIGCSSTTDRSQMLRFCAIISRGSMLPAAGSS
jgi:hypothetical protein